MGQATKGGTLTSFAESAGLRPGTGEPVPKVGNLLEQGDFHTEGAAHGVLPGGAEGILAHTEYTTRSDDSTRTHHHTVVVLRVPEALGYAPHLQMGDLIGIDVDSKTVEPVPGLQVRADRGVDEGWLRELFSPSFCEWLQRSPGDFGAELTRGVLTVHRHDHITEAAKLRALCEDAAKIAARIREESIEESESGGGAVAESARPDRTTRLAARFTPQLGRDGSPANVESELARARELTTRSPAIIASSLRTTVLIMLAVNIIGSGIYGLLLSLPNPGRNVLVFQVVLLAIVGPLVFRSRSSNVAKRAAEEAFYAGWADERDLRPVDPLRFAAEHAQADLPAQPVRVFEGLFGGVPGHVMLTGAGRSRDDRIALVRGPRGPIAVSPLDVSAPGVSTAALDAHIETLVLDLETQPAAAAS